jgi:hypothetical protein
MRKLVAVLSLVFLVGGSAALYAKGGHGGSHSHSAKSKAPKTRTSNATNPDVVHVQGYTKKDGTYVAPHDRTAPNNTKNDNWSTRGNVNPETGKAGTKPRDEDAKPPQPPEL